MLDASTVQFFAIRLKAIALRGEAIALRVEAIATRMAAIAIRSIHPISSCMGAIVWRWTLIRTKEGCGMGS